MTRKPNGAQVQVPMIDPSQLPEDGSPIVYEQTFARRLGSTGGSSQTEEDFENAEWQIERQEPDGWAAIDKVRGRPYKPFLREMHGEGKYRVMPLVGQKPIEALQKIELIGSPVSPIRPDVATTEKPAMPEGDLPVWMRLMLQQQGEERALERERQARAEERREAWERAQAEKEFLRQERQERMDREKREQEAEDRREAARQRNELLLAGLGLVKEFAADRRSGTAAAAGADDPMKTVLLQHLLDKGKNTAPQSSIKETLDLLLVLDTMAQRRAEMVQPAEKDGDDDDMGTTMMKMLPAILAARAGGGGGAPAADPRAMAESMVQQAFRDPKLIAQIAAQNPVETARVFRQAIKDSPELEKAVITVLEEEGT